MESHCLAVVFDVSVSDQMVLPRLRTTLYDTVCMSPVLYVTPKTAAATSYLCTLPGLNLFDHLVGTQLERERKDEAECLGSLEVDHELKLGWLQHR